MEQKIQPPDGESDDEFGFQSPSGGVLIVREKDDVAVDAVRPMSISVSTRFGPWIKNSSRRTERLSISWARCSMMRRLVVGVYYADINGSNSGEAYLFEHTTDGWILEEKLQASDGESESALAVRLRGMF